MIRPKPLPLARRLFQVRKIHGVIQSRPMYRICPHYPIHKTLTTSTNSFRLISTSRRANQNTSLLATRSKNLFLGIGFSALLCFGYLYVTDVRAGIHQWAVPPSLRLIYDDAEEAHEAGTESLRSLYSWGLHPRERGNEDGNGDLSVEVRQHSIMTAIGKEEL